MTKPLTTFNETVRKSPARNGWTYLIWPESTEFFGTRARVKVRGTMDGVPFESAFMPLGDGHHKLPVRADVLKQAGKRVGDRIAVEIQETR